MRGFKRNPWLSGLGMLLAAMILNVGQAAADVNTDQPGSVVVYPKIVSDGTRDTLITLSTTSNMQTYVHCFYTTATGRCSITDTQTCSLDTDCPGVELCVRTCNSTNFNLVLTAQQPTFWIASTGRFASMDPSCRIGQECQCTAAPNTTALACPGIESGPQNTDWNPLPVGTDFVGELKCIQVQADGDTPLAGNNLKGEALIENLVTDQASEYNAINITANADAAGGNDGNTDLLLNWPGSGSGEYNYCPSEIAFTTYAEGAVDTFTGATVTTELTIVPCTEMLELAPTPVGVRFEAYNEFEEQLSVEAFTFDCYLSRRLGDIPSAGSLQYLASSGSGFLNVRVQPSSSNRCLTGANRGAICTVDADCGAGVITSPGGTVLGCRPSSAVLGIAEEFHTLGGQTATAAVNSHVGPNRTGIGDIIAKPAGQ